MPLHPLLQTLIDANRAAGRPGLSDGSPADARALVAAGRAALGNGPEVGAVRDLALPSRAGSVPARLYRRRESDECGLIVYFHGGGWVCGSIDDFDPLARRLVDRSGCAVLQVDYRLAPEHPFPAGLEDAEDAVRQAHAQVADWLGRRVPLAVGGDSAGGNLATLVACRLHGEVPLAAQLLFYPVTDADTTRPSYTAHGTGLPLTRTDMRWFFGLYAPESLWFDPRISPLRRSDLAGSPPACIVAAEYDVLRDEAEAYAQALRGAGVTVEWREAAGLTHGFARMFNVVDTAASAVDDAARVVGAWCAATAGARTEGARP